MGGGRIGYDDGEPAGSRNFPPFSIGQELKDKEERINLLERAVKRFRTRLISENLWNICGCVPDIECDVCLVKQALGKEESW